MKRKEHLLVVRIENIADSEIDSVVFQVHDTLVSSSRILHP